MSYASVLLWRDAAETNLIPLEVQYVCTKYVQAQQETLPRMLHAIFYTVLLHTTIHTY